MPMSVTEAPVAAFSRWHESEINRPRDDVGAKATLAGSSGCLPHQDWSGGGAALSPKFQRSMPPAIGAESCGHRPQPKRSPTGDNKTATQSWSPSPPELECPKPRPRLSNALPLSCGRPSAADRQLQRLVGRLLNQESEPQQTAIAVRGFRAPGVTAHLFFLPE